MLLDCKVHVVGVNVVSTLAQAIEHLARESADAILLDLSLPDSTGMETFDRMQNRVPETPIIVMSRQEDEESAVSAVHRGAQDYLVKGQFDGNLLHRAIRYAIERTEDKRELAKERMLLQELLENIPDRIYFKDRDCKVILVSHAMLELFGLERTEDATGKIDFDFFSPEHARTGFEDEQRIMQTGRALASRIEKETLPDGRIGWVSTTKLPLRNARGEIVGTFGVSRVVARLKRMEEALNAERLLLRNLNDYLPDPIYLKDREGRYELDNRAHREFLGLQDEGELIGKTVYDFFSEEIAKKFHEDDERIMSGGNSMLNEE